ncbi:MAG: hypothetical protein R3C15_05020 [Thermoleophilia bacterium]
MTDRGPEELRDEIARERDRLDDAARRLRDEVAAIALPRRIPWLLVALGFAAGLLAGARLARR